MPRLVSLSRAAKLVGLSRGALQKKVHNLELMSFEGQVSLDDIQRIFPDAEIEDNHVLEDLERIIEQALKRAHGEKLASLLAPDPYTLAARLQSITKEQAHTHAQVNDLIQLFADIQSQITTLSETSNKPHLFEDLNNRITDSIEKIKLPDTKPSLLFEKDTLLRVIAAQVHIKNTGHEFFIEGNNSILEAGLTSGLSLNYGCSNGNCGKCKARLISGEIKKIKPHDFVFSESDKLQDYFLCCSNTAITDIEIEADEADSEQDIPCQNIATKVKKINKLTDDLLILNLKTPRTKRLRFLAGQSATLTRADLPPLELPIASCPCDDMNLQFHVPKNEDAFSQYIFDKLCNSDSINIEGPSGSFLLDEESNNSVIFIAFDSGFGPIKSLIEQAVTLEHAKLIHLFWMSLSEKPYMHNQCHAWEDALDNFNYTPSSYDKSSMGDVDNKLKLITKEYSDLSGIDFYICGKEYRVKQAQQFLIDNEVNEARIKVQSL